jgi:hypothetical protein
MRYSARGTVRRTTAGAVGAAALLGGAVACGGGESGGADTKRSAAQVITAAYEKTAEAKSAKISMTMSMPDSMKGGGDMKMSGVMGWDPTVMDVTMEGSALAAEPDAPDRIRMIWRDNVMYMDMGEAAAKDMDGKRWMKMDLEAMAKASGDEKAMKAMTSGLENMNQDPAQQLAMLLDSPNLKHVGSEKIDGEETQHYKGTLSVKEMLDSNEGLDVLDAKERKQLLDGVEKAGIKGYDTEVWVNEDDLPVRMDVGIDSPEGAVEITMTMSDYGAKADVEVPPAADTFDLFEMLKGLGEGGLGEDAASGEGTVDDSTVDEELKELEELEKELKELEASSGA